MGPSERNAAPDDILIRHPAAATRDGRTPLRDSAPGDKSGRLVLSSANGACVTRGDARGRGNGGSGDARGMGNGGSGDSPSRAESPTHKPLLSGLRSARPNTDVDYNLESGNTSETTL